MLSREAASASPSSAKPAPLGTQFLAESWIARVGRCDFFHTTLVRPGISVMRRLPVHITPTAEHRRLQVSDTATGRLNCRVCSPKPPSMLDPLDYLVHPPQSQVHCKTWSTHLPSATAGQGLIIPSKPLIYWGTTSSVHSLNF